MRLLNVQTHKLEEFYGSDVPEYAALSHTWGNEEITFQDIAIDPYRRKTGWTKILRSAAEAEKHSCKYIWIDTCCIDKTSSAELSEAINSMFRWYRKCKVCLAHLQDVSEAPKAMVTLIEVDSEPVTPPGSLLSPLPARKSFSEARWFERGWTLQELIAPRTLYFYDSTWNRIGEKKELSKEISNITGIDEDIIYDQKLLYTKSIAQKMSWVSERETTKMEDLAYCLMGIFGVNMPLLYGEGERAFVRLQEEIMKQNYDHSLFAWNHDFPTDAYGTNRLLDRSPEGIGAFAPHPSAFNQCADIVPYTTRTEPYATTNRGIQIHLRVLEHVVPNKSHTHLAILQCHHRDNLNTAIALPIAPVSVPGPSSLEVEFYRTADEDLLDIEYSLATKSRSQRIYLLASGPIWLSQLPRNSYRCWLRDHGQELGVRFHKARYCQYPIPITTTIEDGSKSWNYKNNSMVWTKDWRGTRAALYFSKNNGPAFVVVLTLAYRSFDEGYPRMHIHIKSVHDSMKGPISAVLRQVNLRRILEEDFPPLKQGQELAEVQTTFPFESRVMTVRVKREIIHDEEVFVLDLLFSGVKRRNSEANGPPGEGSQD
jgi:hypothetical protein